MEDNSCSFSPDVYIKNSVKYLNNAFINVSGLVGEFDNWARNNGINMTTMKILHAIYYGNHTKQTTIAKAYNLPRTTVNSNIKKMENCGLVILKPLILTEKGLGLAQQIGDFFKELVLKTEKTYGKDPQNIFRDFNTYTNLVNVGFTGKAPANKKAHA